MWWDERFLTFIEDLQSNACLWDVHCAYYKNSDKKVVRLIFLQKNIKLPLLKLRKNRQSHRSVSETS
jgi:hypothetical protein